MTEEQGARIIELLSEIVSLLQDVTPSPSEPLFRDVWPMIAHKYPMPVRIKNAIRAELLSTKSWHIEKYQFLTMKEFMAALRLGRIDVMGLGAASAAQLFQIIEDEV